MVNIFSIGDTRLNTSGEGWEHNGIVYDNLSEATFMATAHMTNEDALRAANEIIDFYGNDPRQFYITFGEDEDEGRPYLFTSMGASNA